MRLLAWRAGAPRREAPGPKARAVVEPVPATLGAEADPHVWIAWGPHGRRAPARRATRPIGRS